LQKQLEGYATLFSRDSAAAAEEQQRQRKNHGCDCILQSIDTNKATDKTREPEQQVTASNSSTRDRESCVRQLAEVRENLKVQEKLSKNCSRRLEQERRNKTTATAAAETCELELSKTRRRLDTKTSSLTECDDRLKEAKRNLKTMDQCAADLKADKESSRRLKEQERQSTKDLSSKLTKCSEELTRSADSVRWMTPQLGKCSENLVKLRGEVQSLNGRLTDAHDVCDTVIENLKRRHQKQLEDVIFSNQQFCDQQRSWLDSAAVQTLIDMLSVSTLVPLYTIVFIWLAIGAYKLILLLTSQAYRCRTLIGIRQVYYRVNFRSPRYR